MAAAVAMAAAGQALSWVRAPAALPMDSAVLLQPLLGGPGDAGYRPSLSPAAGCEGTGHTSTIPVLVPASHLPRGFTRPHGARPDKAIPGTPAAS